MRSMLSTLMGLTLIGSIFWIGAANNPVDTPVPTTRPVPAASSLTVPFDIEPVETDESYEVGCPPPTEVSLCGTAERVELTPADLVPDAPTGAEDWRPLVASFFEPTDVDRAIRVIRCESGGNPTAKNPRSTASGLFQHLASMWGDRSVAAGVAGSDVFDPVANVQVAAWLVYEGGGWSHWYTSRPCWR